MGSTLCNSFRERERATETLGIGLSTGGFLLACDPRETLAFDARAPHLSGVLFGERDGDVHGNITPLSLALMIGRGCQNYTDILYPLRIVISCAEFTEYGVVRRGRAALVRLSLRVTYLNWGFKVCVNHRLAIVGWFSWYFFFSLVPFSLLFLLL